MAGTEVNKEHTTLNPLLAEELPFINRKNEFIQLEQMLKRAAAGRGSIAILSGEAGIGKTRLASEVSKRSAELKFRCLRAKCSSDGYSPLYYPWIEFMRQLSREVSAHLFFKVCGPNTDQVVRLVPELFESTHPKEATISVHKNQFNDLPASIESQMNPEDTQKEEFRFLLALTQVFFRLSEDSPLLLILDDLQWSDAASLRVIDFLLASNLEQRRILLLCLYRDDEHEETTGLPIVQFIQKLEQSGQFNRVSLTRFTQQNIGELVNEVFPSTNDIKVNELNRLLYSRTGGNPLFIEETLKSLVERKMISKNERGEWSYPQFTERLQLPGNIQKVVEQRLARLDPSLLEILRISSVIGEEFDYDVLQTVSKELRAETALLNSSLEKALNSGLLLKSKQSVRGQISRFAFSDESVRDVLYEQVDSKTRGYYHLAVGKVLEIRLKARRDDTVKEYFFELANHYLKGGDKEKAREYFIKAAKRASDLYAHFDAYSSYRSALNLIDIDRNQPRETLLLAADLQKNMGDEAQFLPQYLNTFDCWSKAGELYERCGAWMKAADISVKMGLAYHMIMYELDKSDAALQRAVELAEREKGAKGAELARIYSYSLAADIWRSDRKKVKEKSALALGLAKVSGAYDVMSMISSYGIGTDLASEIEQSIGSCNNGLKIAHEHNLMWEASYNYFHRAVSYTYTYGPSSKSLDLFLEGMNFTSQKGNFMVNLFHKVELVYSVYLPLGEWEKAREMAEESLKSVQAFPRTSLFCLIAESAMGQVLLHLGDLEKAQEYLEHVKQVTNGFGVLQLDVPLYIALSRLYIEKNEPDKAQASLEKGYRLSEQRGLTVINAIPHMQILSLLLEFVLSENYEKTNSDNASVGHSSPDSILSEMNQSSVEIDQDWTLGYLLRANGLMAEKRREFENSILYLQQSIGVFEKLGWPLETARTQYLLALAHLRRGNVFSSIKLLELALATFSRLGAKHDLEKAITFKKTLAEQDIPIIDEHPKFENQQTDAVFETLKTEFMQDFLFKKLDIERCGWRSLNELVRSMSISKHYFYGRNEGSTGPVLKDLLSTKMVETRLFAGERGRGGEVMKIRIALGAHSLRKFAASSKTSTFKE